MPERRRRNEALVWIKKVTTLGISSELFRMHRADKGISKFNEENALDNSHHFDVRFQQIYDWLQANDCRGRIFFVGAGGLGKIYCMWIKQHGGMAYDIGALFDGWAGLRTRPYLNDVQRFRL